MTPKNLSKNIAKIIDDVMSMIERHRKYSDQLGNESVGRPYLQQNKEFDAKAHNFAKVDLIASAEVILDKTDGSFRNLLACVSFIRKVYVQTSEARVEFGVQRAFLTIQSRIEGSLHKNADWLRLDNQRGVYYVNNWNNAESLTLCIDAIPEKNTLQELPLPPAKDENFLSMVGKASGNVNISDLSAYISISICQEGLFFFKKLKQNQPDISTQRKIAAILSVAFAKSIVDDNNEIQRPIIISERG